MACVVGVDLGGTNLRVARVSGSDAGEIVREKHRTPQPEALAGAVVRCARQAAGGEAIDALGVGFAGWVVPVTGHVTSAPNLGWREVPFGDLLRAALPGTKVAVANDLNAIAWGEWRYGAGRGGRVCGFVYAGSGLGSALVCGDVLQLGAGGLAGEIGHVKVVVDGAPCGCGGLGCIEAYLGGHAIDARLRRDAAAGRYPALLAAAGGASDAVDAGLADRVVREGDPDLAALWGSLGDMLGLVLAGYVTVHDIDRLVCGGGVWTSCDRLRELATGRLRASLMEPMLERLSIVGGTLGELAGIIGAADLARR